MSSIVSQLFTIENSLRSLSNDELCILNSNLETRFDLSNPELQKNIDVEKLKIFFFDYIKNQQNKNFIKSLREKEYNIKLIKKCIRIKQPIHLTIQEKYSELKPVVQKLDSKIDIRFVMLKIIYLLETYQIKTDYVKNQIEYIKQLSSMLEEQDKETEILSLILPKRTLLLPGKKRKNKIHKDKPLSIVQKNKIYNIFFQKKQDLLDKPEEKYEEEKFSRKDIEIFNILRKVKGSDKNHFYFRKTSDDVKNLQTFFEFVFKIKDLSNNKIDDIIKNSIESVFEEYHQHFDYIFENLNNEDESNIKISKPTAIPFKYETEELVYVIETSFVYMLGQMKKYKDINRVVAYYIDYLFEKEYIDKFRDFDMLFYLANLKGFLRMIGYKNQSKKRALIDDTFSVNFETHKKRLSRKEKFIKTQKFEDTDFTYEQLILININEFKNISLTVGKNKDNESKKDRFARLLKRVKNDEVVARRKSDRSDMELYLDILVYADIIKFKSRMRQLFPSYHQRRVRRLNRNGIITYYQYEQSEYFKRYEKVKDEEEEKKEVEIDIAAELEREKWRSEFRKYVHEPEKLTEKQKFKNEFEKLQVQMDTMKFKILYGLQTDDTNELEKKYEKMLYQITDNNRNMMIVENLKSKISILENNLKRHQNKSEIIQQIRLIKRQMNDYKNKIKDVDEHGFAYGTNFEMPYQGSGAYITKETINASKKLEDTMKFVELINEQSEKKKYVNKFAIEMVQTYSTTVTDLYKMFHLYVDSRIEAQFEKKAFSMKKATIHQLGNKSNWNQIEKDFAKLVAIIYFIIENYKKMNKFYRTYEREEYMDFVNKNVEYNGEVGLVVDDKDDLAFVQFEDYHIEEIPKSNLEIVDKLVHKNVRIKRGNYKGFMGRVYQQNKDEISLTLDTYGLNNPTNTSIKVRTFKLNVNDIKLVDDLKVKNTKVFEPKDIENKDLFSVARFLFDLINDNNRKPSGHYFTVLYSFTLKQINSMIKTNEKRKSEWKNITDKKHKKRYLKEGFMEKFDIPFRKVKDENIYVIADNSSSYIKEDEMKQRDNQVHLSKEQIERQNYFAEQEKLHKYGNKFDNIMGKINMF